jgi:hypothetical protein
MSFVPPFAEYYVGFKPTSIVFFRALWVYQTPTVLHNNVSLQKHRQGASEAHNLNRSQYIKKITDCQGKNRFFVRPFLLSNNANFTGPGGRSPDLLKRSKS